MSPSKTKNYAASVRQRLLNYARSSGQDFIFVLRTFAMERLLYRLSRSPLQVDCGFGDAITPVPVFTDFPTLLDFPAPQLHTYPKETVVAEKFEAIVRLGMANSRMKDFYDLWALASDFPFSGQIIVSAIQNTFNRRKTPLPTGTPEAFQAMFIQNPLKQTQWQAFVGKTRFAKVEKDFGETIDIVRSFLWPPIDSIVKSKSFEMTWPAGGPWLDSTPL
jgi:hypothetical protein